MKNKNFISAHLVDMSPWPFIQSLGLLGVTFGAVFWWHFNFFDIFAYSLFFCLWVSYQWWKDVCVEKWLGWHMLTVSRGLRIGVLLFILSEIFFFFSFFWAYFHNCWGPKKEVGWVWPPYGFKGVLVDPFSIPLLNTVILLSSGVTVTWSHHSMLQESYAQGVVSLFVTCSLGVFFLVMQVFEYSLSYYSISSMTYGTVFFMLTGFHGMHVIVGTICLLVCFYRLVNIDFNNLTHVGFESAAWYWHFVDVVWLFLFFFVYWYGFMV